MNFRRFGADWPRRRALNCKRLRSSYTHNCAYARHRILGTTQALCNYNIKDM